jgi:hypothetical protein
MMNLDYLSLKLKELLLFLVTLLILVALLEIWARTFTDVQPNLRQKDELIGYRYDRSSATDMYEHESDRKIHMRFNNIGFRGRDYSLKKPDDVTRIAFLGDSMVAALQVDEEDTMVRLLEERLNATNKDSGRSWEVMNFGISGSSPGQSIAVWREEAIRFDPDIVILGYFVGNDLANNCKCLDPKTGRIYFDLDDGVYRQQPHSEENVKLSKFLNANSSFYLWQKAAFRTLKQKLRGEISDGQLKLTFKDGDWIYSSKEHSDLAYAWRLTGEAVKTLNREVTDQGAQFIVVLIPHGPQVYDDLFKEMEALRPDLQGYLKQDYPDQRLGEICRDAGVPFLSMLDQFEATAPGKSALVETEELFFLKGNGHFNELGNLTAAQAVYDFIAESPR